MTQMPPSINQYGAEEHAMKKERYETYPRDAFKIDIHQLAKEMIANGYFGQNMRGDLERIENTILVAAHDPTFADSLPVRARGFWEALDFQYRVWKARRAFNRPPYKNGGQNDSWSVEGHARYPRSKQQYR
jgi:hypothetical protein